MVYSPSPQRGSFVDQDFLKAQCLRSILQHVSHLVVGRYAVTACYKRYMSKIKYKIKIFDIYLKNRSHFHIFKIIIDSVRTISSYTVCCLEGYFSLHGVTYVTFVVTPP